MKKFKNCLLAGTAAVCLLLGSCKDYLDVVPDNVPTVDHAFNNRYQAEEFLYGCFAFLPFFADASVNPALLGGDEVWYIDPVSGINPRLWYIARGNQGTNSPLADYWSSQFVTYSRSGGLPLFTGIRDCNIFLENIHRPFDLEDFERNQWIAEVKFLKAFFHFWLLRMYGPIPVIRTNIPISANTSEVQVYREPIDSVVSYIVELLDEAVEGLPLVTNSKALEMGRPTKPMALAVKAQALTLAASPLFNGNPDYAAVVDKRGVQLFPQEYKAEKWKLAADAIKEAIEVAHEAGHGLFDFRSTSVAFNLSEETISAMQVRGAATERWNSEIIWGDGNTNTESLQRACHPAFFLIQNRGILWRNYAPTLRVVEQFYTSNGVPIEEDKDWVDVDPMELRRGDAGHKYYIEQGFETINLHFNRESRFYGSVFFDGGTLYGNGRTTNDNNLWVTRMKNGDPSGGPTPIDRHSSTGYLCKKFVHYLTEVADDGSRIVPYRYPFPVIRLADLYLLYAEALNEWKDQPDAEVYEYIDLVRHRTGLKGVVESWSTHSLQPEKPTTQTGMREIIQRERLNELAFEGARFWDLRRWKLAKEYLNKPVRGLSILGETADDFYKVRTVFPLQFSDKDYLWPIRQSEILNNKNLVQNPGW